MKTQGLVLLSAGLLFLASCGPNPQRTADQVRKDIDAFRANPNAETQSRVDKGFVKLNEEMDQLETKSASTSGSSQKKEVTELENLRSERTELLLKYQEAKISKAAEDIKTTVKGINSAIQNFGQAVQKSFQSATPDTGK